MLLPTHLPPLILASGSPRRRELLSSLGLTFEVIVSDVDEDALLQVAGPLPPAEVVMLLSHAKAQAVVEQIQATRPEAIVIGADTTVVLGEEILGKPRDRDDAFRMLSKLQGQTHTVFSAITVIQNQQPRTGYRATKVRMKALTPEEIWGYIDTGEPMDKAGAYAIQGQGALLIQGIGGCYFNVVGMSLVLLGELLGCKTIEAPA